ncbi:MAG: hypothetical protein IT434_00340 [Phycisphaerales bacterium]|jgi:hypothetical protein|nr:hypothetical protein [Phycisphaerales bacterium]
MSDAGELGVSPLPDAAQASAARFLDRDVSCVRCSYNLRGLPASGNCPECGEPIANSIKGFMLQDASAEYRGKLTLGLSLVLNGILLLVVVMIGSVFLGFVAGSAAWPKLIASGVGFLVGCMMLLGYWNYTEPDPGYVIFEQPSSARNIVRIAVAVGAAVSLAQFVLGFFVADLAGGSVVSAVEIVVLWLIPVASFVIWVVQFLGVMNYTAWVGGRVPDDFIVRRARTYRWLLPVIYVVGAIVIIGPLIALVMYWNLLDRLRKHLRSIEATGVPADLPKRMG